MHLRYPILKQAGRCCLPLLFPVMAGAQYCAPPGTTFISEDSYNDITNVTIVGTTLNSTTNSTPYPSGYILFPASGNTTATLNTGGIYTINFTYYGPYILDLAMWIDYNGNTTFEASESITLTEGQTSATGTFTVPATAVSGATRMRIMASEDVMIPATGACMDIVNGEVEDYVLTLGGGPAPCNAPANVTATAITQNSTTLIWPAVTGAAGYEYVVNNSAATPVGAGAPATGTSVPVSNLTPGTIYYAYVRTKCSATSFSSWTQEAFSTQFAASVPGVAAGGFTLTAAPNPAGNRLVVSITGSSAHARIRLTDLTGRVVLEQEVKGAETIINTSTLPAGLYHIRYQDAHRSQTHRLVRQ